MACVYASTYYFEPVSEAQSLRHNPIFGSTYLEIKGGDWEMAKTDENGQQKTGLFWHSSCCSLPFGAAFFFNTEALGSLKEMMNIRVQQLTAGGNGVNIVAVG
ncbi:hypothetical protein GBA52_012178 [Prunus armeniaca]|nr:hypothetical protein GBA52_012178 [Prunus armeniaca]